MRTSIACAAVVAVLLATGLASGPVYGQSTGTAVVVIDIPYIFKNYELFKAQINDIKRDIDGYKAFVTERQKEIRGLAEKLEQFRPGTTEYKQLEEEIAKKQMTLQLEGGKRQKEFMRA